MDCSPPGSSVHGIFQGRTLSGLPFPSPGEWMWKLEYKESWVPKNWCFWTMVLEKTLESPLDCKEIKLVNPKGNQSWIFTGSTDAEAETPILWPPNVKNWLTGKDPNAGKDWRQGEKGTTEDEMVGRNHRFNGHEFELTLADSEGQESLVCCSPWGYKELDTTEWLNNNNNRQLKSNSKDLDSSWQEVLRIAV